jgi:hypothetical protein
MNGVATQSLTGEGAGAPGGEEAGYCALTAAPNKRAHGLPANGLFSLTYQYLSYDYGITLRPAKVDLPPASSVMAKLNTPVDGFRDAVNIPVSLIAPVI